MVGNDRSIQGYWTDRRSANQESTFIKRKVKCMSASSLSYMYVREYYKSAKEISALIIISVKRVTTA